MGIKCEIQFDQNQHGTYFTGQVVSGKVTLRLDKVKNVKGIAFKICGYAQTRWTETSRRTTSSGSSSSTKSTTYRGREDYIASITYLAGSEEAQSIAINPGIHVYNFACQIPLNCPTSFEGVFGQIRYMAKVVLVRPWKFDQTHTVGFTVLKLVDLNYESPVLRIPTNMETFKEFCCGPCRSKPLHITADVLQTGYVPGQAIRVNINIDNPTNVQIKEVKTAIILEVSCFSQTPLRKTKFTSVCIAQTKSNSSGKKCKLSLTECVQVPPTPPTCFSLCSIIHISYVLEITTSVSGPHVNPTIRIPITIGNVPLTNAYQMHRDCAQLEGTAPNPEDLTYNDNSLPVIRSLMNPTAPQSSDMNLPPPSYEMAMYMSRANMNEDEKHPLEEMDFAPRYPVYNIPEPSAPLQTAFEDHESIQVNADPNKTTWL